MEAQVEDPSHSNESVDANWLDKTKLACQQSGKGSVVTGGVTQKSDKSDRQNNNKRREKKKSPARKQK